MTGRNVAVLLLLGVRRVLDENLVVARHGRGLVHAVAVLGGLAELGPPRAAALALGRHLDLARGNADAPRGLHFLAVDEGVLDLGLDAARVGPGDLLGREEAFLVLEIFIAPAAPG